MGSNLYVLAIFLILNIPHLVTIELRNLENRSINDYPNKSFILGTSRLFQVFAVSVTKSKLISINDWKP